MKLIDYIKSDRRGRDANELERESLYDPFMADAMQGYEVMSHDNHFDRLINLHREIVRSASRNKHIHTYRKIWWSTLGAAAVVAVGFGVWTILPQSRSDEAVMQEQLLAELEGATRTVGTTEELLAEARRADGYCDVVIYSSAEEFGEQLGISNQQSAINNPQLSLPQAGESSTSQPSRSQSGGRTGEEVILNSLDTIANPAFVSYFRANRREAAGNIVLEFRVNDSGRVSKIQVLAAPTREAGREAIDLLISGPAWTPTGDKRVRTVINS